MAKQVELVLKRAFLFWAQTGREEKDTLKPSRYNICHGLQGQLPPVNIKFGLNS